MNNDEAKKILAFYRPGTADRVDPEFKEALERATLFPLKNQAQSKADAELIAWFQDHCASYASIKAALNDVDIPVMLKDRIMASAPPAPSRIIRFQPMQIWRAAAVLVVCLGLAVLFWRNHGGENDFATYRSRMARTALQLYGMDLATHNLQSIHTYLAERHAPADYVLTAGLGTAKAMGCAVLKWQGQPVSMLCFSSGRPSSSGGKTDLWLFVIDKSVVKNGPENGAPELAPFKKLTTAFWAEGGKTYFLAADGDAAFLRKYF